jgi:hypothetical protein
MRVASGVEDAHIGNHQRNTSVNLLIMVAQVLPPTDHIGSMTRHLHHIMVKSPRQRYRQHDLVALLSAWLDIFIAGFDSAVTSMTRQHRRQHDSAAPLSAWLNIYIASWPSHLGSTVASTTWQRHHTSTWLSTSMIYDFSGKQTCCQLIPVLFTIIFGSRANASIPMHWLAPPWSIYVSKTHVWRL